MTRPTARTPVTGRFCSLQDAETLRALVANLGEGIYVADARGRILDANPAFFRMLGVADLDELGHYGLNDLVVDHSRRAAELTVLDQAGEVREFEMEIVIPNGAHRTVLDTAFVVEDPTSLELYYHGILVDITERKAMEEQLRQEATRDPLTGCFNRRWLHQLEEQLGTDAAKQWGCLFVDIDHFKQYNETFGHRMGDATLVRMARFLMRQIRADESVVRVGGDEFLVVLNGADAAATQLVTDRLRAAALRTAPVPFSLGSAFREDGEALRQTVNRADKALLAVRVETRGPATRDSTSD